jgi:hypothetical protein
MPADYSFGVQHGLWRQGGGRGVVGLARAIGDLPAMPARDLPHQREGQAAST